MSTQLVHGDTTFLASKRRRCSSGSGCQVTDTTQQAASPTRTRRKGLRSRSPSTNADVAKRTCKICRLRKPVSTGFGIMIARNGAKRVKTMCLACEKLEREDGTRVCRACGVTKDLVTCFYAYKTRSDGTPIYRLDCRRCTNRRYPRQMRTSRERGVASGSPSPDTSAPSSPLTVTSRPQGTRIVSPIPMVHHSGGAAANRVACLKPEPVRASPSLWSTASPTPTHTHSSHHVDYDESSCIADSVDDSEDEDDESSPSVATRLRTAATTTTTGGGERANDWRPPVGLDMLLTAALVPDFFVCPLTGHVMRDPVVAGDGFSYERSAIERWLASGQHCSPITDQPMSRAWLPNHVLRAQIMGYAVPAVSQRTACLLTKAMQQ